MGNSSVRQGIRPFQSIRQQPLFRAGFAAATGTALALCGLLIAPVKAQAAPTAISEVIALAEVAIGCPDGGTDCNPVDCTVTNPTLYTV